MYTDFLCSRFFFANIKPEKYEVANNVCPDVISHKPNMAHLADYDLSVPVLLAC